MKFVFIAKHRTIWSVAWLCNALGVSRSGFHAWLNRTPSVRSRSEEALGQRVKASFVASDRTYGARRVWHDMLAEGFACGLHRIERLMRLQALRARPRRRRLPKDEGRRRSSDAECTVKHSGSAVRGRAAEPEVNRRLHLHLDRGGMALPVGRDRPVLAPRGRLVDERHDDGPVLVADALLMAVWRRGKPNELLHHSDQGCQYSSEQFQRLMADSGIVCIMSRSGNVWDNAAMESFFSSLKIERTARKTYRTRNEARADVFD